MGQHAQAHPFIERALQWRQSHLGGSHPDVAASLHRLAECLRREQRFDEARPLYDRAIALYRAAATQGQADVADTLHDLGELHHDLAQQRHDPQDTSKRNARTKKRSPFRSSCSILMIPRLPDW